MMRTNGVVLCAVCQDSIAGQVRAIFSDCFVAGAVYGEPIHPDVVAIRAWRDRHLQPAPAGRPAMAAFVAVYERLGPPLARWVVRRPRVAAGIRDLVLAPFCATTAQLTTTRPPTRSRARFPATTSPRTRRGD